MKKIWRIVAVGLAALFVVSVFAGCQLGSRPPEGPTGPAAWAEVEPVDDGFANFPGVITMLYDEGTEAGRFVRYLTLESTDETLMFLSAFRVDAELPEGFAADCKTLLICVEGNATDSFEAYLEKEGAACGVTIRKIPGDLPETDTLVQRLYILPLGVGITAFNVIVD